VNGKVPNMVIFGGMFSTVSGMCGCRPSTLEQSTCWHPVCLVTYNISPKAENSFISAILPRHCFITASS